MIQQFRSLSVINVIFLIVLLFLLRIGVLVDLPKDVNSGFLELRNRLLIHPSQTLFLTPSASVYLAALLVFVQALLFNRIVNTYNLLGKTTFLPALTYVLVSSIFTPFLFVSPPLICNFFILFILFRILFSIKNPTVVSTMFDLGMVVAIATLVYFPFFFLILSLWIALIIFRPFNWREWFAIIIGYFTIVLFLAVYYLWFDKIAVFYEIWRPLTTGFPVFFNVEITDFIVLLPLTIALILGIIRLRENFFRSIVLTRKTFQFLFFMFVVAVFSFYMKTDYRLSHFHLAVIPIATLLAYYFLNATKRWFYESLMLLIVVFVIYFQFF